MASAEAGFEYDGFDEGATDLDFIARPLKERFEPAPKQPSSGGPGRPALQPNAAKAPVMVRPKQQTVPSAVRPPKAMGGVRPPAPRPPQTARPAFVQPVQAVRPPAPALQVRPPVAKPVQPARPPGGPPIVRPIQTVRPPAPVPAPRAPFQQKGQPAPPAYPPSQQQLAKAKAGGGGLSSFREGQRLSLTNFPEEWKHMDREAVIAEITERLSVFGELAGKPVIITLTDGTRKGFAAFSETENAQNAVASSATLGFNIVFDKFVPPTNVMGWLQGSPVAPIAQQQLKTATFYIDELEMPQRPDVEPSPTDREVWIDPLPDDDVLGDWLHAFGETEEVCRLPNPDTGGPSERGYVLFKTHEEAKVCVDSFAAQWSESERAMSSQLSLRRGVVRIYPESIVSAFLGRGGEDINALRKASGVKKLAVKGADLAMKGTPPETDLAEQRLHFWAEGRAEAIDQFKGHLEKRLEAVHQEIKNKLEAMGDDWKAEQEREMGFILDRKARDERRQRRRPESRRSGKGGGKQPYEDPAYGAAPFDGDSGALPSRRPSRAEGAPAPADDAPPRRPMPSSARSSGARGPAPLPRPSSTQDRQRGPGRRPPGPSSAEYSNPFVPRSSGPSRLPRKRFPPSPGRNDSPDGGSEPEDDLPYDPEGPLEPPAKARRTDDMDEF